jgi:hypothetical protein
VPRALLVQQLEAESEFSSTDQMTASDGQVHSLTIQIK